MAVLESLLKKGAEPSDDFDAEENAKQAWCTQLCNDGVLGESARPGTEDLQLPHLAGYQQQQLLNPKSGKRVEQEVKS